MRRFRLISEKQSGRLLKGFLLIGKLFFLFPRDPNTKTKKVGTFGVVLEGFLYLLRRLPLDP